VSILVFDEDGLMRDSVSALLAREQDLIVVGVAGTADEAIGQVVELKPDLVLMDLDMPGVSCLDAMQTIRSRRPDTKFVLLTAHEHDEHLERALKVKANGFVSKNEGFASLMRAVRNAAAGRFH
jgi:two-component system nitrate/nitrite response regulator NarL